MSTGAGSGVPVSSAVAGTAYCTIAAVNRVIGEASVTATSTPNTTQVNALCESVSNEIDELLFDFQLTVPVVTGTRAKSILEMTAIWGVCCIIQAARYQVNLPPLGASGSTPRFFWQMYRGELDKLRIGLSGRPGGYKLLDAPRDGSNVSDGMRTYPKSSRRLAEHPFNQERMADFVWGHSTGQGGYSGWLQKHYHAGGVFGNRVVVGYGARDKGGFYKGP